MEAKELLTPRFEIIKSYPKCTFNVGRILTPIKKGSNYYNCIEAPASDIIAFPEKYPHLFKRLD